MAGGELNEISDAAFALLAEVLAAATGKNLDSPEKFLAAVPEKSRRFFQQERFPAAWKNVLGNLPEKPEAAVKAFHEWFDGLKTLRFLHFSGGKN